MSRLNDRAYQLLKGAIRARYQQQPATRIPKEVLWQRLEKLRLQSGEPAGFEDLRAIVSDAFPDFDLGLLKSAARLNQPKTGWGFWGWGSWGCGLAGLVVATGGIALANLPLPPIRNVVADNAPLLLLPSFWMMDQDYRAATAATAQAKQLLDNATSAADIELGATKTQAAQAALDRLPVWFLGSRPKVYCSLVSCRWRFSLDEFAAARKTVARLEAQVFQERNAQALLSQALATVETARQQHQSAKDGSAQNAALGDWQSGIDRLREVPQETLAGRQARAKLVGIDRDFQSVTGRAVGRQQVGSLITGAKEYGFRAALAAQKPPHPVEQWRVVQNLWQEALALLNQIKDDDPQFAEAQRLRAEYAQNLAIAKQREALERQSIDYLQQADEEIAQWRTLAAADPSNPRLLGILQAIENNLERVHPASTAYAKAEQLRQFANQALQRYQPMTPQPNVAPKAPATQAR